jgi:hypothetical protein
MGGRGVIESTLNQVFLKNILPQRESWVKHGTADSARTEKALLRHTLNHLMQLLDGHDDVFYPEEVYIFPPVSEGVFTGSVVKLKSAEQWFVVLNPACDLVVRANGHFKADRLFLVGIESEEAIVKAAVVDIVKKEKRQKKLKDVFGNNENGYYHWLPKTKFFSGGFINFRNVHSILKEKLVADFNTPGLQISPPFVKDIVSRFSSYYARQGQPEIDSEFRIDELTT